MIMNALQPLGDEYCAALNEGLTSARWCDRYPNQNKQSGAFSYGTFDAPPYIMMNYSLKCSMMSLHWLMKRDIPCTVITVPVISLMNYSSYKIFVAEVASTFNEELLGHYMQEHAGDDRQRRI